MAQDVSRLTTIGQNLANAATPGYKRAMETGAAFSLLGQGEATASHTVTDLRRASLQSTSGPLDVAIDGEGFFEVQTEAGAAYTRRGDFRLDASGRLVTQAGHVVQGVGGPLTLATSSPTIDRAGRVSDGDKLLGQLKIVDFADPRQLTRQEDGLFVTSQAPVVQAEGATRLRQGQLEGSNVSTAAEMVKLIETVRHFEATQRVIQGVDEMSERALRKLGEF